MARIRTIKPEFCVSAQIADVSPTCRLLFVCMWMFCDDAGIHPASARQLKMEVFPGDDISAADVEAMVSELLRVGLLIEYEATDGPEVKTYWQVTGWHHQKIERPRYQYPQPDSTMPRRHVADISTTPRSLTRPETTRPEEKKNARKRAVSYSSDFEQWWTVYPKKVGKDAAAKAYRQAIKRIEPAALLDAIRAFASTPKANGEFCWNPATWLNQGHWADDPAEWQESRKLGDNGQSYDDYNRERQKRLAKTRELLDGATHGQVGS